MSILLYVAIGVVAFIAGGAFMLWLAIKGIELAVGRGLGW
jgi:hypothetical protein